ncbi:MAG: S4 domain-containing protein [Pontixanthobacter sp.]
MKTRSRAQELIDTGHIRCNGSRIVRHSHPVATGDVLVLPIGANVRIAEIRAIPTRRGSPAEAQACYRLLDPHP